jgi:hypothetical protein
MSGVCRSWSEARHEMDIPTLVALNRYWEHSPPVHVLVARYLGIKPPEAPQPVENQAEALMQMIDQGLRV